MRNFVRFTFYTGLLFALLKLLNFFSVKLFCTHQWLAIKNVVRDKHEREIDNDFSIDTYQFVWNANKSSITVQWRWYSCHVKKCPPDFRSAYLWLRIHGIFRGSHHPHLSSSSFIFSLKILSLLKDPFSQGSRRGGKTENGFGFTWFKVP